MNNSSTKPLYKDSDWLRQEYWREQRTLKDMAEEAGVSDTTIRDWMDRHGIDRRNRSEARGVAGDDRLRDPGWLEEQYWSQELTLEEIGEQCGTTYAAVQYWMDKHGIKRRSDAHAGGIGENSPLRDKDWLREKYVEEMQSSGKIAEELDRDPGTVLNWLRRHGIDVREHIGEYPAELHPTYKGEQTSYGTGWHNQKKERVRERDGRECQDCSMTQEEHISEFGTKLHVHHIKPSRFIDDAAVLNSMDNLIALCKDCHLNKWDRIPFLAPDRG